MTDNVMWINPLDLLPGDSSVTTSFNAITSGVGGGLSGLVIQSNTVGETSPTGGNKVVETALEIPPGHLIKGVRVCYELSNSRSFISQIRLAQVQDPPSSAIVLLDDPADLTNRDPVCVNSQSTSVDPTQGTVLLSLRVNFENTSDKIVIRGLGIVVSFGGQVTTITGNYSMAQTDRVIIAGAITSVTTVILLSTPFLGQTLTVKDGTGIAQIHNIIIAGNGNNIDGSSSFVMNDSYQSITIIFNGTEWSVI